jgi:hypothetical protein
VLVGAGHTAVILEFLERERPILDRVSSNGNGFANHCDAPGAINRRNCVRVSQLWVLIEEQTSHGQVPGNHVGIFGCQGL